MKVLLFYPNLYGMNMLPPAIGLFTSILKQEGHTLKLFDTTIYKQVLSDDAIDFDKAKADNLNARPYDDKLLKESAKTSNAIDDFIKLVDHFKPDLIAMSITEDTYTRGVTLLKNLGKKRPKVVVGGVFPTFAPELTLELSEQSIDYVLIGDGEETLPELCKRLEANEDILKISGLYTIRNGQLITNPLPKPVDVSKNPFLIFHYLRIADFIVLCKENSVGCSPLRLSEDVHIPYTCAYCNSPSQAKMFRDNKMKFFRKRSLDKVQEELQYSVDNYKADSFYFWADTFLAWTTKEFEEFCELYSDFKLPFWMQTETITEYRIKKLKEIGLLRISFGLEHGDEEFRYRVLGRRVRNGKILRNLDIVANFNIPFSVNNIIGFPHETRELAFQTIELNRHIKSDGINAYTFVPFHGTPLRHVVEDMNLIDAKTLTQSIGTPTVINMPQFPPEEIEGIRRCFVLYVKMAKSMCPQIKKAEKQTPEGDQIWEELRADCSENYMKYGNLGEDDE